MRSVGRGTAMKMFGSGIFAVTAYEQIDTRSQYGGTTASTTGKAFHLRFRKLPSLLALDVERAFHTCNISRRDK
jgi:hypothetical protein